MTDEHVRRNTTPDDVRTDHHDPIVVRDGVCYVRVGVEPETLRMLLADLSAPDDRRV